MSDHASLNFEDKQVELPVVRGSEGEVALDISKLRAQTGLITLDRGFKNTGSTLSGITFLNGEEGSFATGATASRIWQRTRPSWR